MAKKAIHIQFNTISNNISEYANKERKLIDLPLLYFLLLLFFVSIPKDGNIKNELIEFSDTHYLAHVGKGLGCCLTRLLRSLTHHL